MIRWLRNGYALFLNAIPTFFLIKYVVGALAFLVWMVFFDQNTLTNQIALSRDVNELEQNIEDVKNKREVVRDVWEDLNSNKEKYARERYYLKKKDEDVFIIQKY